MENYQFTVVDRFLKYVQVDTQSDPEYEQTPSTAKQKDLGKILVEELKAIGLKDAEMDALGYIYATIPATTEKEVPTICFCSHMDTAPDASGTHVKPILHRNFDGKAIVLPDDPKQIISVEKYPYLKQHIGNDVITASGLTLLGADDKSGIAEIMDLANYLVLHPDIKHGTIKILFTPDEEVGRGADHVDLQKLGAQFGYTLDGGDMGDYEDETFSADEVIIHLHGVIAHPGSAYGKLVNALKLGGQILANLPVELSPENTKEKQGFIHPTDFSGGAEESVLKFIIRDFDTKNLPILEEKLRSIVSAVLANYPTASFDFEIKEQYRNMKEILDQHPQISVYTKEAYEAVGLTVSNIPIRGGTDGSRLSFMGLPCPNLFTGMQAIHSRHEWIGVRDMKKAVDMLVALVQVWEQKS